ncbi:hypothetical protein H4R34_003672 [Dimargaris verticillata]|uniref:Uncharacterized protein n=1 Tax=Dimargaris verticillata TaxID=2761393 RepID=A0A9W8AZK3_9FUNG|nr:hypothetical protein H4R34_003672 [Dimargaris verticillata]
MTPAALTPLVPSTVVGLGGPHPLRVLRAHLNTLYLLRHQIRQASELRKQLVSLRKSFVDANTCAICTELLGDPHTLDTPSATSVPFLELQWVTSEDDGEYSNPQATPVPLYTPPPPTQGARTQPAANATQRGDTRSTARSTTSSTRPSAQNNRQQTQSVPTTTSNTTTNMPSAISVPYFELQWGGSEDDDDEYSNPQATPIPLYTPPSPTQSARTQPAQTDNHPAEPATNSDQGGITHSTARSIYHAIDPDWDFDGIANDLGDMTEAERADLEEYIFYSDPRHAMYRYDPSQFEHFDDGDSFDDDLDIPYY